LPWDNAATFQSNLEAYSGGRLASWTVWLAPTTMRPLDAAKRVGMTEQALRSVNNIPPRVVIKAGSSLLVPRSTHLETDVALHLADNGQLSLTADGVPKRPSRKPGQATRQSKAKVITKAGTAGAKPKQSTNKTVRAAKH
jgi:membrane-bound lytic murein transglycosylase D